MNVAIDIAINGYFVKENASSTIFLANVN
jgi:hypothetical protein